MSSVPPLRDEDIALVANWPARPDTPTEIAQQVSVVLGALMAVAPEITGWKRDRAKTVVTPDDIAALAALIERGAVKDSQRPPVHIQAAGYLQWLYPVGLRGVQVMVAAGQVSDRATSSCAVQIQRNLPQLRTAEAARLLMLAVVDAFDPQWAVWTKNPLGDDENLTADGQPLGYLNYGAIARMRELTPNAVPYRNGALVTIGSDPEMADLDVIRRHLSRGVTDA